MTIDYAAIAAMTPEERLHQKRILLGIVAREESAAGYAAFYELIHDMQPPRHVTEQFLATVDEAVRQEKGALIRASRGFWKTDSMTVVWGAWQIGLHPTRSNVIGQVNDSKGSRTSEAIADIIANHAGWKYAFGHIKPDKKKGWGAQGYEVMCEAVLEHTVDADGNITGAYRAINYEQWRELNNARKDPTLVGLGYKSGDWIGSHPDGFIILDDIHDEKNTISDLELAAVKKQVTDVILPTRVIDETQPVGRQVITKLVVIGTPWTDDDVYQYLEDTGQFVVASVPALVEVAPGTDGAVWIDYKKLKGWFTLTWPERFGLDSVHREYDLSGHRGFFRMYMLTLVAASEAGLKYFPFPADKIRDEEWRIVSGLDWASIRESKGRTVRDRSYYAHYWGALLPGGGIVVVDGTYEQLTTLQAETDITKLHRMYARTILHTYFEDLGKGEEAYNAIMSRNPGLPLIPFTVSNRAKKARTETDVAPYLESGALLISDADTPALNALRKACEDFPFGQEDPLDGLYMLVEAGRFALNQFSIHARPVDEDKEKQKNRNPFRGIAGNRAANRPVRQGLGGFRHG